MEQAQGEEGDSFVAFVGSLRNHGKPHLCIGEPGDTSSSPHTLIIPICVCACLCVCTCMRVRVCVFIL
jgi:hypothetical protein